MDKLVVSLAVLAVVLYYIFTMKNEPFGQCPNNTILAENPDPNRRYEPCLGVGSRAYNPSIKRCPVRGVMPSNSPTCWYQTN
jgi:hypothetical protein